MTLVCDRCQSRIYSNPVITIEGWALHQECATVSVRYNEIMEGEPMAVVEENRRVARRLRSRGNTNY